MPQRLVVSLELTQIDYCNSLLAGLPLSLISNYQREQNCAARLVVRASPNIPHQYSLSSTGYLSKFVSRTKLSAFVSVPLTPSLPLISLISFISILLLDHFVPVLTPVSCNLRYINTRRKVIVQSLIFGPSVWNSLPPDIRNATTITTFKFVLKITSNFLQPVSL